MNYQAEKLAEWQKEAQEIIDRDLTPGQTYQAVRILALIELVRRQETYLEIMNRELNLRLGVTKP